MNSKMNNIDKQVESLNNQIVENFLKNVRIVSNLVFRNESHYLGSHAKYVSKKATLVAKELNLSEDEVMEIRIAGLLHNIGEIGFSSDLLTKYPGEMDKLEFQNYSLHPYVGMQILKTNSQFDSIGEIILQHQELMDGTGFPLKLVGNNINIGARIIGLIEFFHDEVYKKYKSGNNDFSKNNQIESTKQYLSLYNEAHRKAIRLVKMFKTEKFDPKLVEVFMKIIDREIEDMNDKILVKVGVEGLEPGMICAKDYYTKFGMKILDHGELIYTKTINNLKNLVRQFKLQEKFLVLR